MSRDLVAIPAEELAGLRRLLDRANDLESTTVCALITIRGILELALDHPEVGKLKFPSSLGAAMRVCHSEAGQALKTIGIVEDEGDLPESGAD